MNLVDSIRLLANDIRHGRDSTRVAKSTRELLMAELERQRQHYADKTQIEKIKKRPAVARAISSHIAQLETLERGTDEYKQISKEIIFLQDSIRLSNCKMPLDPPIVRQIEDVISGIVIDFSRPEDQRLHLGVKYRDSFDAANRLDQFANMLEWPEVLTKQIARIYDQTIWSLKDGKLLRRGLLCRKTRFLIAKAVKEPFLFECIENRPEDVVSASRKLEFEELEVVEFAKQYIAEKHNIPIQNNPKAASIDSLSVDTLSANGFFSVTTIKTLEQTGHDMPCLDTKSVDWIIARKKNEKKLGLPIKTLKEYRHQSKGGQTSDCKMFGQDKDGRFWRRQTTVQSAVYYLKSSLPQKR